MQIPTKTYINANLINGPHIVYQSIPSSESSKKLKELQKRHNKHLLAVVHYFMLGLIYKVLLFVARAPLSSGSLAGLNWERRFPAWLLEFPGSTRRSDQSYWTCPRCNQWKVKRELPGDLWESQIRIFSRVLSSIIVSTRANDRQTFFHKSYNLHSYKWWPKINHYLWHRFQSFRGFQWSFGVFLFSLMESQTKMNNHPKKCYWP